MGRGSRPGASPGLARGKQAWKACWHFRGPAGGQGRPAQKRNMHSLFFIKVFMGLEI